MVGLVFGEAVVFEGLSPGASEVLVDLLASTPVVEGSTTDHTRGLSTFRVVCESAITIFGSVDWRADERKVSDLLSRKREKESE